jgi:hypothetical protein
MPVNVYLAGPMSGLEDFNFPAFFRAQKELESRGMKVFNPAQADIENYGSLDETKKKANYRDCLRIDLNWILDHAEAIALLPGWENSKGVEIELALARVLKLEEIYL